MHPLNESHKFCPSCGRPVTRWAVRCPRCHRECPTMIQGPETGSDAASAPEPGHRTAAFAPATSTLLASGPAPTLSHGEALKIAVIGGLILFGLSLFGSILVLSLSTGPARPTTEAPVIVYTNADSYRPLPTAPVSLPPAPEVPVTVVTMTPPVIPVQQPIILPPAIIRVRPLPPPQPQGYLRLRFVPLPPSGPPPPGMAPAAPPDPRVCPVPYVPVDAPVTRLAPEVEIASPAVRPAPEAMLVPRSIPAPQINPQPKSSLTQPPGAATTERGPVSVPAILTRPGTSSGAHPAGDTGVVSL